MKDSQSAFLLALASAKRIGDLHAFSVDSDCIHFVINNFYFLFFHTQHNRISKIKQNKTADTYSTSQGSIKREGEREGQQEHKSHSFK